MLEHTFCHLPSIGPRKERNLWQAGVHRWCDVDGTRLSAKRRDAILATLDDSRRALDTRDARWFSDRLNPAEHWRLFALARAIGSDSCRVAYLDIETTGMQGHPGDHVTTIALYDGRAVRTYVHGRNLDDFPADAEAFDLLVTYNGKCFDAPYLRAWFGIELPQAHIDLRYILSRLGYKGGLKGCERALGLDRGDTDGIDGYFAVLLWQEYRRTRDERCLETLLAYNADDVLNLERLMVIAWNRCVGETPFGDSLLLPPPPTPANPFAVDRGIVDRLLERRYAWA